MSIRVEENSFLQIGDLAQQTGVSADTLCHYERKGLLKPRRLPNGYRVYPAHAVQRVRLVQCALSLGFKLDELARVLKVRDQGGAPCRQVLALAAAKFAEIEEHLSQLTAVRDELRDLLCQWEQRLAQTDTHEPLHLLEDLADTKLVRTARRAPFDSSWQTGKLLKKERNE